MHSLLKNTAMVLSVLDVLKALTRGNFKWQKKILVYDDLVDSIILLEHDYHNEKSFWILLFNISQHRGLLLTIFYFFSNNSKQKQSCCFHRQHWILHELEASCTITIYVRISTHFSATKRASMISRW